MPAARDDATLPRAMTGTEHRAAAEVLPSAAAAGEATRDELVAVAHATLAAEILDGELVEPRVPGADLAVVDAESPDEHLSADAWSLIDAGTPANTKRPYQRYILGRNLKGEPLSEDVAEGRVPWHRLAWEPWCRTFGRASGTDRDRPATPQTLAQWAADLVTARAPAPTIEQALAAVARWHRHHGHGRGRPDRELADQVLKGYRKGDGAHQVKRVSPITLPILNAMFDHIDRDTVIGRRDAAMLVIGLSAMMRRSELATTNLKHVTLESRGLRIYFPHSKTDQVGKGADVYIPASRNPGRRTDPTALVRAVLVDLADQGITEGTLFQAVNRAGRYLGPLHPGGIDVARVVKRYAAAAGLHPDEFSGHSLRAGGATSAYIAGASVALIMKQGRWKNPNQVYEYVRFHDRYEDNAAALLNL